MQLNGEALIRLPREDSKTNYLAGFWQWVSLLADGDYERAVEALYWPKRPISPGGLKKTITTFFGGKVAWSVVIPNARLVGKINDAAECAVGRKEGAGWLLAQIPVTTAPSDSKSDQLPLMGLATSFFVREHEGTYVLEFELFHA